MNSDKYYENRGFFIDEELASAGIHLQQFYLDDELNEWLEMFAETQDSCTADDVLQYILVEYINRNKLCPESASKRFPEAIAWLGEYKARFDLAYETGYDRASDSIVNP